MPGLVSRTVDTIKEAKDAVVGKLGKAKNSLFEPKAPAEEKGLPSKPVENTKLPVSSENGKKMTVETDENMIPEGKVHDGEDTRTEISEENDFLQNDYKVKLTPSRVTNQPRMAL